MATGVTPQQLEAVMMGLMQADTTAVMQATQFLNQYMKSPDCVAAFVFQLRSNPHEGIRQLCAVLLRKRIARYWTKLPTDLQIELRTGLLQMIMAEPSSRVRLSEANVISMIARYALPTGDWNDLPPQLLQALSSQNVAQREVAMKILSNLIENIGELLEGYWSALLPHLQNALMDASSSRVRIDAMHAVGTLLALAKEEQQISMQHIIPVMADSIRLCLSQSDEEGAIVGFEILDDLVEFNVSVIGNFLQPLLQFVLEVVGSPQLPFVVHKRALDFVQWIMQFKPKALVTHGMVGQMINALLHFIGLSDDLEPEEDQDKPCEVAGILLDRITNALPTKHTFRHILQGAAQMTQSQDPLVRRGAQLALAYIAEGCREPYKGCLSDVVNMVIHGFNDPVQEVREGAYFAVRQFSEYLQPEIVNFHGTILPVLFSGVNQPNARIAIRALYALEAFVENMNPQDLLPYLQTLMERLVALLQTGDFQTQEIATGCIASLCMASSDKFEPFFDTTMAYLRAFMQLTGDQQLTLRARATECAGYACLAVKRPRCDPYVNEFMTMAFAGLQLEFNELNEFTFAFFSHISETLKEDFVTFFPAVFQAVTNSCESADGISGQTADDGDNYGGLGDASDEDDGDDDGDVTLNVRTAFLDEKCAALHCLATMAVTIPGAIASQIEGILDVMETTACYFHSEVRESTMKALHRAVLSVHKANPCPPYTRFFPPQEAVPQMTLATLDRAVPLFVTAIREDDDKDTVAYACEGLAEIMKAIGPCTIRTNLVPLSEGLIALLDGSAPCQNYSEDEDEEVDHDIVLLDSVAECICGIVQSIGPSFAGIFENFYAPLAKYMKPSRPPQDRATAIGVFADIVQWMGPHIAPFLPQILPFVGQSLQDLHAPTRRNGVFCAGLLVQNAAEQVAPQVPHLLPMVLPLAQDSHNLAMRDNAIATLARIILYAPNAVKVADLLGHLANGLPLQEDKAENDIVCQCIITLMHSQELSTAVSPYMPKFIETLCAALEGGLSESMLPQVVASLQRLSQQFAQQMQQMIGVLTPGQQAAFQKYVMGTPQ